MASERSIVCKCDKPKGVPRLFELLRNLATRRELPPCDGCRSRPQLRLTFPFKLGANSRTCDVLAVFQPKKLESWPDGKKQVTFYPFLVVLKDIKSGNRIMWLPYWHAEEEKGRLRRKYGQWAPAMSDKLFFSLISQARDAGFIRTG